MGRARTSACLLTVSMLAAGGCAAESDVGDSPPPGDVATRDGGDHGSESPQQDDEAIAEAVLLTIDDFPTGWEAETIDDGTDVSLDGDIGQCLGVDDDQRELDGAHASSTTFTSPMNEQVSASVVFASSSDEARRAFESLHAPETPGCFANAFDARARREGPPEGVEVGEPTFDWLPFDSLGDDSVAIRGTLPVTVDGVDVALHGGAAFVRVGRGVITVTFSSALAPFDTDELRRLTGIVVERLSRTDIAEASPE